ncbi:MAG TPA: OsmC family protein [Candidatus Cybelea sp.]
MKTHSYQATLQWAADGAGTVNYRSYLRDFTVASPQKPEIAGSSDPAFRGNPSRYNPEELLVASLSSCHLLWYLHLCSRNGIAVLEYRDDARGTMRENPDGSGEFVLVELHPAVTIAPEGDRARALALHEEAHRLCFIARSVNFPVEVHGETTLACRIPEFET